MGYNTTAERNLDKAKACVKEAIIALTDIVVTECHGMDEFKAEYRDTMSEVLQELIDIKRRLH